MWFSKSLRAGCHGSLLNLPNLVTCCAVPGLNMLQDEVETSLLKQVPGEDRVIKHTSTGFEETDFIAVAIVSTFLVWMEISRLLQTLPRLPPVPLLPLHRNRYVHDSLTQFLATNCRYIILYLVLPRTKSNISIEHLSFYTECLIIPGASLVARHRWPTLQMPAGGVKPLELGPATPPWEVGVATAIGKAFSQGRWAALYPPHKKALFEEPYSSSYSKYFTFPCLKLLKL